MKTLNLIIAVVSSILMFSCREPSQPEERIVGLSNLVSDTYINGDFINLTVFSDPGMTYGFDADADSRDVYVSIEAGESNSFRMKNVPYVFDLEIGEGGLINAITSTLVADYTYKKTVTANGTDGSQKLVISISWDDGGTTYRHDISNSRDDKGGLPISIYAKVYNKRIFTNINIYYLYNTTTDLSQLKNKMNKIYSQAVCGVDNIFPINKNPDKSWDLNGNGKLDIYPNDPTNSGDEFNSIKNWAKAEPQNYWDADNYGIIVLDQPFVVHNNDGTISSEIIPGETDDVIEGNPETGNFTVLSSLADYDVAAHEYLHSKNSTNNLKIALCLSDLTYDAFNLMYYAEFSMKNEILRYRPEIRESGGTESQWQIMTGKSF